MIEPEDLMIPATAAHRFEFAPSASGAVNLTTLRSIAANLSALEPAPVIGAFDADHIQQIHARIFENAIPQAGQLRAPRPSSLSSSLDNLFDRLVRENRLKGLELGAWSKRAMYYRGEIELINPFEEGSDLASAEFVRELAIENGITLRWKTTLDEFSDVELQMRPQTLQSENLRRLLILAVDPDISKTKSISRKELHNFRDFAPFS